MDKVFDFIINNKRKLFFFTICCFLLLIGFVRPPQFVGKLTGFKLENNEDFEHYAQMDSIFNKESKLFLLIKPKSDSLNEVFESLKLLKKNLKNEFPYCDISSVDDFYFKMIRHWQAKDNSLNSFYFEAKSVPILKNLLSKNNKTFLLIFNYPNKQKLKMDVFDTLISKKYPHIESISAMSTSHIEKTIEKSMTKDILLISLLIVLLFVIFFSFLFRHFFALFYTVILVLVSLSSLLLLFYVFNLDINLISIITIPILLILTLSDAQHLLSGYIKKFETKNKDERIKQTLKHYLIPSFLSSLTTSTAFFSFYLFNESAYIKEFGLITSIALIIEFVIIFSLAPFLLYLFDLKKIYDQKVNFISSLLSRHQKRISVLLLVVFISSIFVLGKIKFYTDSEMFFPSNTELMSTHKEIMSNYYATVPLNIFVEPKNSKISEDYVFKSTKILVEKIHSSSNKVIVNSATEDFFFRSKFGVKVNLFNHLNGKNPYYDSRTKSYKIELFFKTTKEILAFKENKLKTLIKAVPKNMKVSFSSPTILLDEINKSVSKSLINSTLSSLVVIFLIILALSRSLTIAFLSLIPNIIPLSFIALIFFLFGLEINILTAITGVVCLGLLDDDTIHILYRKIYLKEELDELSFSILSTAILLIVGFSLFLISSFQPIRVFGFLSALVFLVGIICEMTMMQYVLTKVNKKSQLN